MKIVRTNLTPGMTVLLILLGIFFAFIIIPILIILGFCWLVVFALTGKALTPATFFRRQKDRRRERFYEEPFRGKAPGQPSTSAANDDTIECEVISARTLDENGQEIR